MGAAGIPRPPRRYGRRLPVEPHVERLGERLLLGRRPGGAESWSAFFWGGFDAGNTITVDKPPAALWPMALSVKLFGLQLVRDPPAAGAHGRGHRRGRPRHRAAVGSATAPGLLAGLAMALTPVAVLMFRFNNPDALLTPCSWPGRRDAARRRGGLRPVAGPRRRPHRLRLPHQDAPGAPRPARARPGLPALRRHDPLRRARRARRGLARSSPRPAGGSPSWSCGPRRAPLHRRVARPTRSSSSPSATTASAGSTGSEVGSVGNAGPTRAPAALWRTASGDGGRRPDRLAAADRPAAPGRGPLVHAVARRAPTGAGRLPRHGRLAPGHRRDVQLMQGIFHEYYTVALAPAIAALVGHGFGEAERVRARGVPSSSACRAATTAVWAFSPLVRTTGVAGARLLAGSPWRCRRRRLRRPRGPDGYSMPRRRHRRPALDRPRWPSTGGGFGGMPEPGCRTAAAPRGCRVTGGGRRVRGRGAGTGRGGMGGPCSTPPPRPAARRGAAEPARRRTPGSPRRSGRRTARPATSSPSRSPSWRSAGSTAPTRRRRSSSSSSTSPTVRSTTSSGGAVLRRRRTAVSASNEIADWVPPLRHGDRRRPRRSTT